MATFGSFDLASFGSSLSFSFQSTICGNFISSPSQIKFQDQQIDQCFFEELKTSNIQQLYNHNAAKKVLKACQKILIKQALSHWKTLIITNKQQKQQKMLKGIHKLEVFMNKKLNYKTLKYFIKMRQLSSIIFKEKQKLKYLMSVQNQNQSTFQKTSLNQQKQVFNIINPESSDNIFKNKNQLSSSDKSLNNFNIQTQISIDGRQRNIQRKSSTHVTSMDKIKDSDSFNSLFKYLQKDSIRSNQQQTDNHLISNIDDAPFELSQSIIMKQVNSKCSKINFALKCLGLEFQNHSILPLPKTEEAMVKGKFIQNPKSNRLIHQRPDQQYTTINDNNDTNILFFQNKLQTKCNLNQIKLLKNSKSDSNLKVDSNKNNNKFNDLKSTMKPLNLKFKKEFNQVLPLKYHNNQYQQLNNYKSLNQNNRYFSSLKKQSNNDFLHKLIDHKRQQLKQVIQKKHGIRCLSKISSIKSLPKYDNNMK